VVAFWKKATTPHIQTPSKSVGETSLETSLETNRGTTKLDPNPRKERIYNAISVEKQDT